MPPAAWPTPPTRTPVRGTSHGGVIGPTHPPGLFDSANSLTTLHIPRTTGSKRSHPLPLKPRVVGILRRWLGDQPHGPAQPRPGTGLVTQHRLRHFRCGQYQLDVVVEFRADEHAGELGDQEE